MWQSSKNGTQEAAKSPQTEVKVREDRGSWEGCSKVRQALPPKNRTVTNPAGSGNLPAERAAMVRGKREADQRYTHNIVYPPLTT